MTWETKYLGTARRSTQERFSIHKEVLEFACPEHVEAMKQKGEGGHESADEFAKELVTAIGSHLSINDLKAIAGAFQFEIRKREIKRSQELEVSYER